LPSPKRSRSRPGRKEEKRKREKEILGAKHKEGLFQEERGKGRRPSTENDLGEGGKRGNEPNRTCKRGVIPSVQGRERGGGAFRSAWPSHPTIERKKKRKWTGEILLFTLTAISKERKTLNPKLSQRKGEKKGEGQEQWSAVKVERDLRAERRKKKGKKAYMQLCSPWKEKTPFFMPSPRKKNSKLRRGPKDRSLTSPGGSRKKKKRRERSPPPPRHAAGKGGTSLLFHSRKKKQPDYPRPDSNLRRQKRKRELLENVH